MGNPGNVILPPNTGVQPPLGILVSSSQAIGVSGTVYPDNDFTSSEAAYASALANLSAYSDAGGSAYCNVDVEGPDEYGFYSARIVKNKYKFLYHSATCYLALYWYRQVFLGTESTVNDPQSLILPFSGNPCVPSGFQIYDSSTWLASDEYDFTIDWDGTIGNQQGFLFGTTDFSFPFEPMTYSAVAGYVPPTDGSANGFPT